jgi:hypothetical protein
MNRQFSVPDDDDFLWVAERWIAASRFAEACGGQAFCGELTDLDSIQLAVDALAPGADGLDRARALGLAFGRVFVENHAGYDWWIFEDEHGRDICLRFRETTLAAFPGEMFANRFEDGEAIDVHELYRGLDTALEEARAALAAASGDSPEGSEPA